MGTPVNVPGQRPRISPVPVSPRIGGICLLFGTADSIYRFMLAKVYSQAVYGIDAFQVEVEVDVSGGAKEIFNMMCANAPNGVN